MVRLDRARRLGGLTWIGVGLVFQLTMVVARGVQPGLVSLVLIVAGVATAAAVLARAEPVVWLTGWVLAVLLGLDFAGAVADRFGVFGPPGDPGVSWGSWEAFVTYTGQLLPGAGHGLVEAAAVAATVAEVFLGALLVSGWQRRWIGKAAAGLLGVYLVAMASSSGWLAVADYAVPVLVGAALLVSICPSRRPPRPRSGHSGHVDTDTVDHATAVTR